MATTSCAVGRDGSIAAGDACERPSFLLTTDQLSPDNGEGDWEWFELCVSSSPASLSGARETLSLNPFQLSVPLGPVGTGRREGKGSLFCVLGNRGGGPGPWGSGRPYGAQIVCYHKHFSSVNLRQERIISRLSPTKESKFLIRHDYRNASSK